MLGKSGVWRRRLLGAIAAGVFVSSGAVSASAADAVPPAVAQKVAEHSDLWSKLSADPSRKLPVIVNFKQPAVPSAASFATAEDADAALTRAIHAAQDAILGDLFPGGGLSAAQEAGSSITRMSFTPMFGIVAGADEVAALAANPNVVSIAENIALPPTLNQSLPLIQMPQMFAAGFDGQGYHVAVLDTGARRGHKFLSSRIVSEACFNFSYGPDGSSSRCPGGVAQAIGTGTGEDCTSFDGCGHGTHVAGIAAGFNTNQQSGEPASGVGRGAGIIAVNVFSLFPGTYSGCGGTPCVRSYVGDQILGLEHVYSLRNSMNIASVNMSLGGGLFSSYCDSDPSANYQKPAIDLLRAAGIATVVAAGNNGSNTHVSSPGCISSAVTVASSTKSDGLSIFSNWGTVVDVVAPGSSIYASTVDTDSSFDFKSGTSMAAPHVAGAFAALREVKPTATVTDIEIALESTGVPISWNGTTKPRIEVNDARMALGGGISPVIVAATTPVARAAAVGQTVTAFATILNAGSSTATSCSVAKPAGSDPFTFSYQTRDHITNALGPVNTPVNIPQGGRQDFLMVFTPTGPMSTNLPMVFDCTNTNAVASVSGLNTFLLTASTTAPADVISTAVTPTNDGVLRVPAGGTGVAALAANNIGASTSLQARLSSSPIGGSAPSLPLGLTMCRTNTTTGACITAQASTIDFTANSNEIVTFTAFATYGGSAVAFSPADRRLFIHFYQGSTPVGSASVAVCTIGAANCAASGGSSQTAELALD